MNFFFLAEDFNIPSLTFQFIAIVDSVAVYVFVIF